jgi:hypothetical protein
MNILTAKEFIKNYLKSNPDCKYDDVMIEFTKFHVEAALKAANENAEVTVVDYNDAGFNNTPDLIYGVDSDSILNAYPLNNIK